MRKITAALALVLTLCMVCSCAFAATEYIVKENGQTYPLVNDKITLSMWYPMASSMGELADYNDGEFWQWLEEKTNVHIDFQVPATGTEKENFNLLFAADKLPDILYFQPHAMNYRGGEDQAIKDGAIIALNDYLDLCPNYMAWLEAYPELKNAVYSDEGNVYGFWGVWLPMYPELGVQADQGIALRKDFLDKVGKDVPVTYDDWYDVLCAFRDELGVEIPLYTSKYGIDPTGEFMAGFGTAPYFYMNDGVIKYGPLDDEYKEYLTMLNKWWSEGLLDKEFATRASTGITADNDVNLNDKVGSLIDYGTRLSNTYVTRGATNPDFYLIGVQQPVKQEGDIPTYRDYSSGSDMLQTYVSCITADCADIETAIRWIDSFYAMDVYLNANFGLEDREGLVWYTAEDGHRIGDYDFRYSNPDGDSSATVLVKYWSKNPNVRVESCQIEQSDANKQEGWLTWSKFAPTSYIPTRVTMTSEEGTEYASYYTDIETYVQECNVKFIMGQMSLDEYDAYRDTLRSMGIERCIELRQAALDRYLAR